MLKIKLTHGLVGNDGISSADDRFFYLSEVNLQSDSYGYTWGSDFNNYYQGYVIDRYSNANVTWEVAEKSNYGIEIGLFNSLNMQNKLQSRKRTHDNIQDNHTVAPDQDL